MGYWSKRLGRNPEIPLYKFVPTLDHILNGYKPGHVIVGGHFNPETGALIPNLKDYITPNDVVYVPLYRGSEAMAGPGVSAKLPSYTANIRALDWLAPLARGILIGNAAMEVSFKHLLWQDLGSKRALVAEKMADFVYATEHIVTQRGGRVVYGPIDWDLCIDCYYGNGVFLNAVRDVGGWNIVFCGYAIALGTIPNNQAGIESIDLKFCPFEERRNMRPLLRSYIASHECWSGIGFEEGLNAGNDRLLKEFGFSAGVIGFDT